MLLPPIESWGELFLESMIDIELFRKILSDDNGYIECGDTIPLELFELMGKYPKDKVKRLFKKVSDTNCEDHTFLLEIHCSVCNEDKYLELSKTRLLQLIGKSNIVCRECQEKEKIRQKEKQRQKIEDYEIKRLDKIKQNTDDYISEYLDPERHWKKNISYYKRFELIKNANVDWNIIKGYINDINYCDFLKTPYWKAISERVKYKAKYKCQICNSTDNLCVHHRSYSSHGDEVHNLEDLICICKDCHTKHHFE